MGSTEPFDRCLNFGTIQGSLDRQLVSNDGTIFVTDDRFDCQMRFLRWIAMHLLFELPNSLCLLTVFGGAQQFVRDQEKGDV